MARQSWEAVAHTLAARLMYAAYCPEDHDPPEPDCPSCEDIAAYRAYVAKCRSLGRTPMATSIVSNAVMVPLDQILAQARRTEARETEQEEGVAAEVWERP